MGIKRLLYVDFCGENFVDGTHKMALIEPSKNHEIDLKKVSGAVAKKWEKFSMGFNGQPS